MTGDPVSEAIDATLEISRRQERLRQERAAFDADERRTERWFLLRLVMGWVSVPGLLALGCFAGWVMVHHDEFPSEVVTLAASAILVDSLGLFVFVWRIVLERKP
jgi:hypothetical protein